MMKTYLNSIIVAVLLACSCDSRPSSPTPDRRFSGHYSAGVEVQASSAEIAQLTNRLTQLGFSLKPKDHRQTEELDWQIWHGAYRNMTNMSAGLLLYSGGRLQIRLGSGKNAPANAPAQLRHFLRTEVYPIIDIGSEP